jgi:hypothetical protein
MTASVESLERRLIDDLAQLGDRLADDRLCADLYRALASRALSHASMGGHVALRWRRAEEIVNRLRAERSQPPLERLAQSGGEGEVSDRAASALAELDSHRWEREAHEQAERARLHRA